MVGVHISWVRGVCEGGYGGCISWVRKNPTLMEMDGSLIGF